MESLNDAIWIDEEMYDEGLTPRAMNVACSISVPSCEADGNNPQRPTTCPPAYYGPSFWNSRCSC